MIGFSKRHRYGLVWDWLWVPVNDETLYSIMIWSLCYDLAIKYTKIPDGIRVDSFAMPQTYVESS